MARIQQQVFDYLKSIGRGTIYAVAGDLMPFTGNSFNNARFLSQLLFIAEGRDNEYAPITFKEWRDAGLSRHAVEKARYFFYRMGLLEYRVKKDRGNPTSHYKLNLDSLLKKMKEFFNSAKPLIFSSFADSLKLKSTQVQNEGVTTPKLQLNKVLESKNIGQEVKRETKQEKKKKYENFYL